jgi:hypothetical protein
MPTLSQSDFPESAHLEQLSITHFILISSILTPLLPNMTSTGTVLPVEVLGRVFFWLARGKMANYCEDRQEDSASAAEILERIERQDEVLNAAEVSRVWRVEALFALRRSLPTSRSFVSERMAGHLIHSRNCE